MSTGTLQEESLQKARSVTQGAGGKFTDGSLRVAEMIEMSKDLPTENLTSLVAAMQTMERERKQPVVMPNPVPPPDEKEFMEPLPDLPENELPEGNDSEEQVHIFSMYIVVPISAVFFVVYNVSTIMEKFEINAIPESFVVIVIGVGLGWFMKTHAHLKFFEDQAAWAHLNTLMLNFMLLPIIIFAGGWGLRRHDFYSQLPYILLFAVGGTAVATCVVASLMQLSGLAVRWRTAFVFASLISATDPVATLTTYSKFQVHPLLNIMVFGESTINDAVAIVLFKIFNSNELMGDPTTGQELSFGWELVGNIGWGIFKTFFGSLAFGMLLGMLYTLIARACDMSHNKKAQILVIFVSCYLTYGLAETLHLSGIVALTFCSLVMGVYMRPHLSNEGCILTTFFVKQIGTLADTAVFLIVGVSVVHLTPHGLHLGLYVTLFCLIARFLATVPTALIVNSLKMSRGLLAGQESEHWNLLEPRHIFMMWHGGLRGGIALALAWELGPWVDIVEGRTGYRNSLQSATFLIILAFLVIFGGSTAAFLKYFKIPMGEEYPEDFLSKHEYAGADWTKSLLKKIDHNVLTPILIGREAAERQEREDMKEGHEDEETRIKKSMALHTFLMH